MNKIILALLMLLPISEVHAQLLTKRLRPTEDSSKAMYYVKYIDQEKGVLEKIYYLNDTLFSVTNMKSVKNKVKTGSHLAYFKSGKIMEECNFVNNEMDGKYTSYYENGTIYSEIDYSRGKYNGLVKSYYENGNKRRVDKYKKGKLIEGKCFGHNGQDTTYFTFMQMASFQNGNLSKFQNYVSNQLVYPEKAANMGISGKVIVGFCVDTTGKVVDVEVIESPNYYLSRTAVDIILNSPKWAPAIQEGKKVKQLFYMPFNFVFNCDNLKK